MNYYLLSLLGHITGLAMLSGIVLAGYIANRRFWRIYMADRLKAIAIIELTAKYPVVLGIGMLLLIVSGMSLIAQSHGVFAEQSWFRIKMILVLLLVVSGFIGKRLGNKMKPFLQDEAPADSGKIMALKSRVTFFHVMQLLLLIIVFTLGVFKFN